MPATEISRWVKKQRARKRQSQIVAADAIGMSRTWLSSLENGKFRPQIEEVVALSRWSGVALPEVLSAAGYSLEVIAALRSLATATPTEAISLSPGDLDAIADRSAQRVRQMLRDEGWAPSRGDAGPPELPPPSRR